MAWKLTEAHNRIYTSQTNLYIAISINVVGFRSVKLEVEVEVQAYAAKKRWVVVNLYHLATFLCSQHNRIEGATCKRLRS